MNNIYSNKSSPSSLEAASPSASDIEDSNCSSLHESPEPEGESPYTFGHPLQRMVPIETLDVHDEEPVLSGRGLYRMPTSQASSTASHFYYVDFEAVVDEYLSQYEGQEPQDLVFVQSSADTPTPCSLILRRMPADSNELCLLQALNSDELRKDPWNPAPRLLYVAERATDVILCIERLFEYDQPPMETVANVIDYIRQALEGLSFLHEHKIAHMAYGNPHGVMMDIGRPTTEGFDRTSFPVRYYRINFSQATKLDPDASLRSYPFRKDVQDCGVMLSSLIDEVPKIGHKLKSLVNALKGGEYGADDARKLFDALCKNIDSSTYDAPLSPTIPQI
ncbi:hypothetical protein BV25DRAFT_1908398 [Artomyces pyxidatus]|uniref:Uncharacterized protein n=1 Tax=Artomyces pyxidatus TaxID=48021 RepID=A0ACB8SV66_9AGAM|nr:hypothetical protein BV25DRAFT_1908398 [Artomyces pyxidatus]